MKKVLMVSALILGISGLSGCAKPVQKTWEASGGSKADAVVELSFFYNESEKPQYSDEQGKQEALKRCQAWGYTDVEPFGTLNYKHQGLDGWFHSYMVTMKYQCLGGNTEAPKK